MTSDKLTEALAPIFLATNQNPMMRTFMPQDPEGAWELAKRMAATSMVPDDLRGKTNEVFAIFARAASVGIDWSNALHGMHSVKGRVGFGANLIAAICATSPEFEVFDILNSTETSCTIEAKKKSWEKARRYTVTIEGARQAGFNSSRWKQQPRVMLQNMAKREAGRMWNPAGLMGMYEPEEIIAGMDDAIVAEYQEIEPATSRRVQHGEEAPVVQQPDETKVAALVREKARQGASEAGDEAAEVLVAANLAKKKAAAAKRKATLAKKKLEKELDKMEAEVKAAEKELVDPNQGDDNDKLLITKMKEAHEKAVKEDQAAANQRHQDDKPDDRELDLDMQPPWEQEEIVDPDAPITASEVRILVDTMRKYNQSMPEGEREKGRIVWDEYMTFITSTYGIQNHTQIPSKRFDVALETLETMIAEAMESKDA